MSSTFIPIVPLLKREDNCPGPDIQLGDPAKRTKILRLSLPVPLAGSPETLTQILISSLELRPTDQMLCLGVSVRNIFWEVWGFQVFGVYY